MPPARWRKVSRDRHLPLSPDHHYLRADGSQNSRHRHCLHRHSPVPWHHRAEFHICHHGVIETGAPRRGEEAEKKDYPNDRHDRNRRNIAAKPTKSPISYARRRATALMRTPTPMMVPIIGKKAAAEEILGQLRLNNTSCPSISAGHGVMVLADTHTTILAVVRAWSEKRCRG